MNQRIKITPKNIGDYFFLEKLSPEKPPVSFGCSIPEYNEYLFEDVSRSYIDHIATTWLLYDAKTGGIAAYMSLIMDAIKLSITEKENHHLNYPFKTIPAMKIAKLAVDKGFSEKYKGLGSIMIYNAMGKAINCNEEYCAARFLTVDADVEHDEGLLDFYKKNGFEVNGEVNNKNRKTISMRKDIFG